MVSQILSTSPQYPCRPTHKIPVLGTRGPSSRVPLRLSSTLRLSSLSSISGDVKVVAVHGKLLPREFSTFCSDPSRVQNSAGSLSSPSRSPFHAVLGLSSSLTTSCSRTRPVVSSVGSNTSAPISGSFKSRAAPQNFASSDEAPNDRGFFSRSSSRSRFAAGSWSSSSGGGKGKLNITETDKLASDVRDRVVSAVEKLGGRVTVGDVAAKAGLNLTESDRALNALAADSNGFLEVSDEGDVLYVFPKDLRGALAQRSLRVRFAPLVKKVQDVGSYVVRVSFGTALLVSIAVVYIAIAALLNPRSDNDRGDRGGYRGGYGYGGGPAIYFDMTDLFWYWDPFYYQRLRARRLTREMSFIESVFSFVFGDGDPNEGLDEKRWQAVGELIARKGGVVAAQELAPFLDIPKDFNETESYMLPVLQRFDGAPEVDAQGNILYKFPSLQRTAQDWSGRPKVLTGDAAVPSSQQSSLFGSLASWASGQQQQQGNGLLYFAKNFWDFSSAPGPKRVLAAGLGVVNLVGVLYLSYLVRDPMIVRQAGSEFVNGVVSFLPWLQAYATAFFAIPAFRWFDNQRKNEKILEENERREESALQLAQPSAQLRRKLLNAREQGEKVVLDQERVIYTTAQDVADQSLEAKEWERKLGSRPPPSKESLESREWDKNVERTRLEEWR